MADVVTRFSPLPTVVSFCGSDLNGVPSGGVPVRISAAYGVWASKRAATRATAIVAKSESLAEKLSSRERERTFVIPSGIDLELFRPLDRQSCLSDVGWPSSKRYVVTYGGSAGKRVELVRAAAERASNILSTPVELKVLAGVNPGSVPLWLNASHALVLASVSEGSPNVVKEALACDIPVISTDVGDVAQRIDGIDGVLPGSCRCRIDCRGDRSGCFRRGARHGTASGCGSIA